MAARAATFTVAASDATPKVRETADYLCDGVADNVQIQAAIDALPAGGGKVALSEGNVVLDAGLTIISKAAVLEGAGQGATQLQKNFAGGSAITVSQTGATNNMSGTLGRFNITGTGAGINSGNGILYDPDNTADDFGYLGFLLEEVETGSVANGLVLGGGATQSMSDLMVKRCRLAGNVAGMDIQGVAINVINLAACSLHGGQYALRARSTGSFIETLMMIGGVLGNGTVFGADLGAIANTTLIGVHGEGNEQFLNLQSTRNFLAMGCRIDGDSSYSVVIGADCQHQTFINCYSDGGAATHMFRVEGGATGTTLIGNRPAGAVAFLSVAGELPRMFNNIGYATANSGTATVLNGQTTIVVAHGLVTAPTRVFVTATLWSNAAKAWVTAIGAATFTINVDADPGAGTAIFDWKAQFGEG